MATENNGNSRFMFPLLLLLLAMIVGLIGAFSSGYIQFSTNNKNNSDLKSTPSQPYSPGEIPSGEKVELIVDYGDGHRWQHSAIKWSEGMTVLDAMQAAKEHPRGLDFKYQKKAEMAFLEEIDAVKNQGGTGQDKKKNWLYTVNQQKAKVSFAVYQLKPSDVILWKYQTYE